MPVPSGTGTFGLLGQYSLRPAWLIARRALGITTQQSIKFTDKTRPSGDGNLSPGVTLLLSHAV